MILIGVSRVFDENAETLGLQIEDKAGQISDTYGVYEVLGCTVMGTITTMFRSKIRPSQVIILMTIVGGIG